MTLEPKVLILDEPTSMLDVSIQAHVMNILKELQEKKNLTYLFISHDLEVLQWFCDEICVMKQGEIVEQGTKNQIINMPSILSPENWWTASADFSGLREKRSDSYDITGRF